jgi:thiamine biosynthesis lipoprotein
MTEHAIVWHASQPHEAVAGAHGSALGTTVEVVVWPPSSLDSALEAVETEVMTLDLQASRFRTDSELSHVNASSAEVFWLSDGLAEVMRTALQAAQATDGLVDPTLGRSLIDLGYDRDFAEVATVGEGAAPVPVARFGGWRELTLEGNLLTRPVGTHLDVGATAKGLGADRAARAAGRATRGGGVLVSLGGDIAVAGTAPSGGWPVAVSESSDTSTSSLDVVRLSSGGIATSSTLCRAWQRGDQSLHHIVDPRTGSSALGPWRSATVIAASCARANTGSTAAIVSGSEAQAWLSARGYTARLVGHDGAIETVGPWPEEDRA